jgi:DNA-directed RNA polymerase beta' subunit
LQHIILQFLLKFGYTMSIGDAYVPKKVHNTIGQIIETKRKEVMSIITEYENDPYVMTREAHEISLQASLAAIQGEINDTIMNNLNKSGGLYMAIMSGSSGASFNAGQIVGCIGQIILEEKRILRKFNKRTLPMFHKYDDGAFARGFCRNSFMRGLNAYEFFYAVMAGREGIINTAIKTADKQQNRIGRF